MLPAPPRQQQPWPGDVTRTATSGHRCGQVRPASSNAGPPMLPGPAPTMHRHPGTVPRRPECRGFRVSSRPSRPARPGQATTKPGLMLAGPARAAPCRAAWRPAALTGQPPRHEALTGHSQVTLTPTSRRRWVRRRFGQGWLHDHGRCLGSPPHAGVVRRPGHLAGEISGHLTSCRVMKTFTTSSPGAHVVPALGFRLPSRAVVAFGRAVARRTRFGSHGRQWSGAAGACDAC